MINDSVLCGRQKKAKGRKVEEGSCCFALLFCFDIIIINKNSKRKINENKNNNYYYY
jgi:hypothetical protein